jgi:hypothetical protein
MELIRLLYSGVLPGTFFETLGAPILWCVGFVLFIPPLHSNFSGSDYGALGAKLESIGKE